MSDSEPYDPLAQTILPDNPFAKLGQDNTLEPANREIEPILDSKSDGKTVIIGKNGGRLDPWNRLGKLSPRPASPTAKLRDAMREGLVAALPQLYESVRTGRTNMLQFADFLAKYSIGTTGTIALVSPDVTRRLEQQVALIASRPTWEASELLEAMRDIWA